MIENDKMIKILRLITTFVVSPQQQTCFADH